MSTLVNAYTKSAQAQSLGAYLFRTEKFYTPARCRLARELNMCFNVLYTLLNTIQTIAIREANRYKVHQKAF